MSVLNKEILQGIKDFIKSNIILTDTTGAIIDIPVIVRKPDEDFKLEEYPSITIFAISNSYDSLRHTKTDTIINKDIDTHSMTLQESPIPYNLLFQLDIWTRLNTHMDDLVIKWLGRTKGGRFEIEVTNSEQEKELCFITLKDDLKRMDFVESTQRTFRSTLTYSAWGYIDEHIQKVEPMVTTIINRETEI